MSTIVQSLLFGESRIVIFGAGYIGYSTAAFYAKKGIRSLLIDIDKTKVDKINKGNPPYIELQGWMGFDISPVAHLIKATTDWRKVLENDVEVVFICVNTERNAEPWTDALKDVATKIAQNENCPLVIIESTMAPGWVEDIVLPLISGRVAVAPRRDWFTLAGMTLESLDRVVGATDEYTLREAVDVLGIVSQNIHRASNYRVAELVKSIENAYRQVGIALSFQLALKFPTINIREALALASTKWNMELYQPSVGIGGYCLPLAPKYLLSASDSDISIFKESIKSDNEMSQKIAEYLKRKGVRTARVLGIAYKGDLKVHIASPGIRLADTLQGMGIVTGIHDPLYSWKEILELDTVKFTPFPHWQYEYDATIIACDHTQYKSISQEELVMSVKNCRYIIDAYGIWEKYRKLFEEKHINYKIIGEPDWIDLES